MQNETKRQEADVNYENYAALPNKPLSKSQKIGAILLAFFSMAILVLWFMQMRANIYSHYAERDIGAGEEFIFEDQNNTCAGGECLLESEQAALKNIDTDSDGLSDWDELNVYHTSAYLSDTDSDGFYDKYEIDKGTDPNCYEGRDCYGVTSSEAVPQTNVPERNTELSKEDATTEEALRKLLSGESDINSIRQALLSAGMDPKALEQISDEDLLNSYQDTLGQ